MEITSEEWLVLPFGLFQSLEIKDVSCLLGSDVMGGRLAGFMVLRCTPLNSDKTFSNLLFRVWKAVLGLVEVTGRLEQDPSDMTSSWEVSCKYQN